MLKLILPHLYLLDDPVRPGAHANARQYRNHVFYDTYVCLVVQEFSRSLKALMPIWAIFYKEHKNISFSRLMSV
jgi:hypothetical protein